MVDPCLSVSLSFGLTALSKPVSFFPMNSNEIGFAKSVLWHLASIQADVYQNQLFLAEVLARQTGKTAAEIQGRWKVQSDKLRMNRYLEALKVAGIDPDSGSKPEDTWSLPWWVEPSP
jgi:hypothetical protein